RSGSALLWRRPTAGSTSSPSPGRPGPGRSCRPRSARSSSACEPSATSPCTWASGSRPRSSRALSVSWPTASSSARAPSRSPRAAPTRCVRSSRCSEPRSTALSDFSGSSQVCLTREGEHSFQRDPSSESAGLTPAVSPQMPAPGPAQSAGPEPPFLGKPHRSLSFVLGKMGTLWADTMQGDPNNMNPRPANRGLRRALPLAVALVIGAAAGAGAYALSNHSSAAPSASPVVVPAQPASSTSTVDSLTQLYKQDAPGVVDITVQLSPSGGSSGGGGLPFGSPNGSQKAEAEGTG